MREGEETRVEGAVRVWVEVMVGGTEKEAAAHRERGGVARMVQCAEMEMLQADADALDDQGASTWSTRRRDERVRE